MELSRMPLFSMDILDFEKGRIGWWIRKYGWAPHYAETREESLHFDVTKVNGFGSAVNGSLPEIRVSGVNFPP